MIVRILQTPWTERYYGAAPSWIEPGRAMVIFRRPMRIEIEDGLRVWELEIPVGYISDRASVPRITSPIVSAAGDLELASYPHDFLYSHGGRHFNVTKKYSDEVFRATLVATPTHIPHWKIQLAYFSVRVGGDGGWKDGWADWPSYNCRQEEA